MSKELDERLDRIQRELRDAGVALNVQGRDIIRTHLNFAMRDQRHACTDAAMESDDRLTLESRVFNARVK